MAQILKNWMISDDAALNALHQILLYNARALLLLAFCLLVLKFFKFSSAASRHFLIATALVSIILIPLSSQLIPAVDIVIDVEQPVLLEALTSSSTAASELSDTPASPTTYYFITLLFAYILITTVLILRIALDNLKMLCLFKLSKSTKQHYWQNALKQHKSALGIHRNITLVHTSLIKSPSTWGTLHPVIFIPNNAVQWPDHLITSTLLHELSHIKRFDCLVQQLAKCICAIYWINPLCWKVFKKLSSSAETACDDSAITSGLHKTRYATDLLHVAEHVQQHTTINYAALNMAATNKNSQLSDRVVAILSPDALHAPMNRLSAFIIIFAIVCLFLPFASLRANFIERIKIQMPVVTALKQTKEEPVDALLALQSQQSNPLDEFEILPLLITETTLELTPKPHQPKLIRKEDLTPQSKPVIITQLQPISTNKVIEKVANRITEQLPTIKPIQHTAHNNHLKILQEPAVDIASLITNTLTDATINAIPALDMTIHQSEFHQKAVAQNLVIPNYPRKARSKGIEGEVTVEYSLDKFGKVINAEIVSAGPSKMFDRQALKAIKKSTFNPSTLNGRPIAVNGLQEKYVFVLES